MAHLWMTWEAFIKQLPPKEFYLGGSCTKNIYLECNILGFIILVFIPWWKLNENDVKMFSIVLPFYSILILNWCENGSLIFKSEKRIYFSLVYAWTKYKKKLFIPVVKQRKSCVISCLKSFNMGKPLIHFMLFPVFLEFGWFSIIVGSRT